jgi:uncharacterized membrane protein
MNTTRLEAFSDGVLAVVITIMVLELKIPHGEDLAALRGIWPIVVSYILSFIFIGIYWSNHHHMLHAVQKVNGAGLWANLHLLFWLSLVPFATAWMHDNHFAPVPVAVYGFVLFFSAVAYYLLSRILIHAEGADSLLAKAIGSDRKGLVSLLIYAVAIAVAFFMPTLSMVLYMVVAVIWLVPDRRIETRAEEIEEKRQAGGSAH